MILSFPLARKMFQLLDSQVNLGKMTFSSVFRRVNVKELISNVPVYTSTTGNYVALQFVTLKFELESSSFSEQLG